MKEILSWLALMFPIGICGALICVFEAIQIMIPLSEKYGNHAPVNDPSLIVATHWLMGFSAFLIVTALGMFFFFLDEMVNRF